MDENKRKSDTLAQRDKARKDFLELKKMQQENAQENKEYIPYENEIKPRTFLQKLAHFWDYYKVLIISCAVIFISVGLIVASCAKREKSDMNVVIYDSNIVPDMYIAAIEDYFEKYCEDYNGDGKIKVTVINCTYQAGGSTAEYQLAVQQKLQSIIVSDRETMIFVTGANGYGHLQGLTDIDFLNNDGYLLNDEFYSEVTSNSEINMPKGLTVYSRNIKGTLIENDEKAQESFRNAQQFLEKMKNSK